MVQDGTLQSINIASGSFAVFPSYVKASMSVNREHKPRVLAVISFSIRQRSESSTASESATTTSATTTAPINSVAYTTDLEYGACLQQTIMASLNLQSLIMISCLTYIYAWPTMVTVWTAGSIATTSDQSPTVSDNRMKEIHPSLRVDVIADIINASIHEESKFKSNKGGWQSSTNWFERPHASVPCLRMDVYGALISYMKATGRYKVCFDDLVDNK